MVGLLIISLFFFAVLGASWFSNTRPGQRLGAANFHSFTESAHTIFQLLLTGDDWHLLMRDSMVQPPFCTVKVAGLPNGDCGWAFSPVYFVAFRWLCESLILNLLVGITLNNFTFLTDDVNHTETEDWRKGASLSQVILAAKAFRKVDSKRRGFVPLTSLHRLLFIMPQPLGFRKPDGGVQYSSSDKVTHLLIRAELNLLTVKNAADASEQARGLVGRLRRMLEAVGLHKLQGEERVVSYAQVMVALWCWQKPDLVSTLLRRQRRRAFPLIYATANALRIFSALRNLVTKRQKRHFHDHLAWSRSDVAYQRRVLFRKMDAAPLRARIKARERERTGGAASAASKATGIALRSVDRIPRHMVAQHRVVEERFRAEPRLTRASGCEVRSTRVSHHI